MKIFNDIIKSPVITLLILTQIYFSVFAINEFTNATKKLSDEIYFVNSIIVCNNEANLNNKTSGGENVLSAEKIFNDNFYNRVLTIAESLDLLFFINAEKNPNYLLSIISEQRVPRSPPLS